MSAPLISDWRWGGNAAAHHFISHGGRSTLPARHHFGSQPKANDRFWRIADIRRSGTNDRFSSEADISSGDGVIRVRRDSYPEVRR